ncbi:ABC transporter ATP-binding protein [Levilactobacillus brevis]|uniref:ABC-type cobalt transport system, ATPase component n=2 Tax=Levilactobacillus brevis TaxID=1580 RepID=Q03PH9_LEVBA|nr:ABC transporter ATP-binding protein [Levilactobacillus brevis]MBL3536465.1 ABC transporter ATP-binding protein [Lactobacillus sp. GPR40-2]MBL3629394.1 ABC transporter ATP-binding protein [Lactobacillus sp. GPB7-4]ABJ64893.1 ABC-type cobalt transport system, ATPase component [Levilactobacillus brevis ATCC 367]ARQ92496.1 ABC transporter ATP-binding protein [Levilactobacillus brevis]ARW51429.1 Energy-coupling factor transporter ATP-binding protein EcfA1 [Levilactobacillus brevis]
MTTAIRNLTFTYPNQEHPVLADLSATFPDGSFNLLTGPSGGGKSTLLKLIAGLLPLPTGSQITLAGQALQELPATQRASQVAMLFQEPSTQFTMDTVLDELRFALENQQIPAAEMPAKIAAALDFVGITSLKNRHLTHLSGGEQQKVALAVIVAMDSKVILLDEPFASIDPAARLDLLQNLVQLSQAHSKTIILADHDLSFYERWIDHLSVLEAGHLTTLSPEATQQRLAIFSAPQRQLTHVTLPDRQLPVILQGQDLGLRQGTRQLINPQDLSLFAHQITLITGPNGSGKSTLLRALVRLTDYQGTLTYDGINIQKRRRKAYARQVALMFQSASAQFLNVTVAEEIALSHKYGRQTYFTPERVDQLLAQLNLTQQRDQIIYTLSGGQQKKVQLLCMLMMAPQVLLLDEPLKGLDYDSIQTVLSILKTVQHDLQLTLIMISHQLSGLDGFVTLHLQLADCQLRYQEADQ